MKYIFEHYYYTFQNKKKFDIDNNKNDNRHHHKNNNNNIFFEKKNDLIKKLSINENRLKEIHDNIQNKDNPYELRRELFIREAKALLQERKKLLLFYDEIEKEKQREIENDLLKMITDLSKEKKIRQYQTNLQEMKKHYLDQCDNNRKQNKIKIMMEIFQNNDNNNEDEGKNDNIEDELNNLFNSSNKKQNENTNNDNNNNANYIPLQRQQRLYPDPSPKDV